MEQYTRDDALQDAMNYIYQHDCDNVCVVAWKSGGDDTFTAYSCGSNGIARAAAHMLCEFVTETINTNPDLIADAFEKLYEEQEDVI